MYGTASFFNPATTVRASTLWMPRVPNGRGVPVLVSTSRTCDLKYNEKHSNLI